MGNSDRNLLFGVVAFQNQLIDREQLIAAIQAWAFEKTTPLAEHLVRLGALKPEQRDRLELLVNVNLELHDNDPAKSMAEFSSIASSLVEQLTKLGDADINATMASWKDAGESISWDASQPSPGKVRLGKQAEPAENQVGRFKILRPHARGGLGQVSLAKDLELGREVAFKEIQPDKADIPQLRSRFIREAEVTGLLEHPGIVPIYGLGQFPDGRPYYAMRFIDNETLHHEIDRYHLDLRDPTLKLSPTERNLRLRRLLQRFIDICEAMDYAHSRGVLHRDLKPQNVMIGRYGETMVVDWGLAKLLGETPESHQLTETDADQSQFPTIATPVQSGQKDSSDLTQDGLAMGTVLYMSPEQAAGQNTKLTPASDVFSLGAILFEILTGRAPYDGNYKQAHTKALAADYPRPRTLNSHISKPLEAICLKAMAKQPQDRYATAKALAKDLEAYLADEPVSAKRETLWERAGRLTRRYRSTVMVSGAALLMITLGSIVATYVINEAKNAESQALAKETEAKEETQTALKREQATVINLKSEVAHNHYQSGMNDLEKSRFDVGLKKLFLAYVTSPDKNPRKASYLQILQDRGSHLLYRLQHEDAVSAVAFSPDGTRVLTGSSDKTARLWDAQTGEPLGKLMQHQEGVWAVAFSPDGTRVLTGSSDNKVQLWEAQTGEPLGKPLQHQNIVYAVAFSPDGTRVLTGSKDKTARVWDAETGEPLGKPMQHNDAVIEVAFSPDGTRILTGSWDHTARLWDAQTTEPLGKPLQHQGSVRAVSFSPDGTRVLTGSEDHTARLWDAQSGEPLGKLMKPNDDVSLVAFSPDGTRVLTGSEDNTARLWDAQTGEPLGKTMQHQDYVTTVAFSPDGTRVLTGSEDRTARLWDAQTGEPLGIPLQHQGSVRAVSFSPDGTRVLTGSSDKTARLWDAQTTEPLGKLMQHQDSVRAVSFSPDGTRVLTGSSDKTARLWDAQTTEPLGKPMQHNDVVIEVAFSPDGTRILTGSLDFTARLWDAQTTEPLGKLMQHQGSVRAVSFSPDGTRVLTGSEDHTARLWDAQSGEPLGKSMQHNDAVIEVAFSPDGTRILTGSLDFTARLWDTQTTEPLGKPMQHQNDVYDLAFSPDGTRVLTGSEDRTARLWDAQTGEPLGKPLQHQVYISAVAFSPDGTRVLTGSYDKSARLWDVSLSPIPQNPNAIWSFKLGLQLIGDKFVPLTKSARARLVKELLSDTKYQTEFTTWMEEQTRNGLDHQASQNESRKNWHAAVWYLTQLNKLEPKNDKYEERLRSAKVECSKQKEERKNNWPSLREKLIAEAAPEYQKLIAEEELFKAELAKSQKSQWANSRKAALPKIQAAQVDQAIQPIPWDQAAAKFDQVIKVTGQVKQTFQEKQDDLINLSFGDKKIGEFCIIVPVKLIPEQQQKEALAYAEKTYVGKTIVVTGLVEFFLPTKTPQITIDSLEQLQVIESK